LSFHFQNDENETDKVFRSRGLKGVQFIRASPGKEPRTLSSSSLRSRKRMESLLQRARDFMLGRDREKKRAEQKSAKKPEVDAGKHRPAQKINPDLIETVVVPTDEEKVDDVADEARSPVTRRSKRERAKIEDPPQPVTEPTPSSVAVESEQKSTTPTATPMRPMPLD